MLVFELLKVAKLIRSKFLADGLECLVFAAVTLILATESGGILLIVIPLFAILTWSLQSDRGPVARVLMSKPAQFLGRISYSIYMIHFLFVVVILIALRRALPPMPTIPEGANTFVTLNPWMRRSPQIGLVAAVIVAATITYSMVEEPGRLFGRRRFVSIRSKSLEVPPSSKLLELRQQDLE